MEIKTIKFLPTGQMKIVKEILIVDVNQDGNEFVIGSLMYERILSTDYKFIEVPENQRDFSCYIDYPKQDLYPNDNVDNLILQSIQNSFPKSLVKNHTLLCNVDEEKIRILKNKKVESGVIRITPDFSGIDIYNKQTQQLRMIQQEVNIYTFRTLPNALFFYGHYDIADVHILDMFKDVVFI